MREPIKISQSLLVRYLEAVGDVDCRETQTKGLKPGVETESGSKGFRPPPRDASEWGRA